MAYASHPFSVEATVSVTRLVAQEVRVGDNLGGGGWERFWDTWQHLSSDGDSRILAGGCWDRGLEADL